MPPFQEKLIFQQGVWDIKPDFDTVMFEKLLKTAIELKQEIYWKIIF